MLTIAYCTIISIGSDKAAVSLKRIPKKVDLSYLPNVYRIFLNRF